MTNELKIIEYLSILLQLIILGVLLMFVIVQRGEIETLKETLRSERQIDFTNEYEFLYLIEKGEPECQMM